MKPLVTFLFLLFFPVLLFSCTSEDPAPEESFSVKKDGVTWTAVPNIFLYQDTLRVVVGDMNRHISLKVKFTGAGEFGSTAFRATYNDVVGGDVFVSEYTSAEDPGATFVISDYNPETKEIKGTFHFNARKIQGSASYKETMAFTNGKFRGAVVNRNWF